MECIINFKKSLQRILIRQKERDEGERRERSPIKNSNLSRDLSCMEMITNELRCELLLVIIELPVLSKKSEWVWREDEKILDLM